MTDEGYPSGLEAGIDAPGNDGEEDDDKGMTESLDEEEGSSDVRVTVGQGLGGPLDTIKHDKGGNAKRRVEAGMVLLQYFDGLPDSPAVSQVSQRMNDDEVGRGSCIEPLCQPEKSGDLSRSDIERATGHKPRYGWLGDYT